MYYYNIYIYNYFLQIAIRLFLISYFLFLKIRLQAFYEVIYCFISAQTIRLQTKRQQNQIGIFRCKPYYIGECNGYYYENSLF